MWLLSQANKVPHMSGYCPAAAELSAIQLLRGASDLRANGRGRGEVLWPLLGGGDTSGSYPALSAPAAATAVLPGEKCNLLCQRPLEVWRPFRALQSPCPHDSHIHGEEQMALQICLGSYKNS